MAHDVRRQLGLENMYRIGSFATGCMRARHVSTDRDANRDAGLSCILPPPLKSPPFCRAGSPPRGGDGHKVTVPPPPPQICTIVSQCKSASARC